MTTINEAKNTEIWVIGESGFPEQTNIYDWVMNFEDENRLSVEFQEELDPESNSDGVYKLRYHKMNRPSVLLNDEFETAEDAENEKFNRIWEFDFQKSCENTSFFYTEEEADNEAIEILENRENIDKDVAVSIYAKSKRVAARRLELDKIYQAEARQQRIEHEKWKSVAIPAEAESIKIDDEFKAAIKAASILTGKKKSEAMATAFNHLLFRQNIGEIKSDFWQVFRIIKAKAEIKKTTKHIVRFYNKGGEALYMCATNFSKSYSTGVVEFNRAEDAKLAALERGITDADIVPVSV